MRANMKHKNKANQPKQGYTGTYAGTYAGYADRGHEGHQRLNQQPSWELCSLIFD